MPESGRLLPHSLGLISPGAPNIRASKQVHANIVIDVVTRPLSKSPLSLRLRCTLRCFAPLADSCRQVRRVIARMVRPGCEYRLKLNSADWLDGNTLALQTARPDASFTLFRG